MMFQKERDHRLDNVFEPVKTISPKLPLWHTALNTLVLAVNIGALLLNLWERSWSLVMFNIAVIAILLLLFRWGKVYRKKAASDLEVLELQRQMIISEVKEIYETYAERHGHVAAYWWMVENWGEASTHGLGIARPEVLGP